MLCARLCKSFAVVAVAMVMGGGCPQFYNYYEGDVPLDPSFEEVLSKLSSFQQPEVVPDVRGQVEAFTATDLVGCWGNYTTHNRPALLSQFMSLQLVSVIQLNEDGTVEVWQAVASYVAGASTNVLRGTFELDGSTLTLQFDEGEYFSVADEEFIVVPLDRTYRYGAAFANDTLWLYPDGDSDIPAVEDRDRMYFRFDCQ